VIRLWCRARLFDSLRFVRLTDPSGSPQVDRNRRSKQAAPTASISGASRVGQARECMEASVRWRATGSPSSRTAVRARARRAQHPKLRPSRPGQLSLDHRRATYGPRRLALPGRPALGNRFTQRALPPPETDSEPSTGSRIEHFPTPKSSPDKQDYSTRAKTNPRQHTPRL
jgi:hypothetical protein